MSHTRILLLSLVAALVFLLPPDRHAAAGVPAKPAAPAKAQSPAPAKAQSPAPAKAQSPAPAKAKSPAPRIVVDAGAADLFRAEGVDGAFVLLDPVRNVLHVSDPVRAKTGYIPASTFKIPNTLIGLETGVIPDERFALPWDGRTREITAWNQNHDMASAMRFSVVWFYQEIARRIGAARMTHWISALGYGNRDIGGGIDSFWLDGALRISPRQQVAFLHRMVRGDLPVRPEHAALVLRLMELERQGSAVLRGKTGLARRTEPSGLVGWLVGVVEVDGTAYPYATLVLMPRDQFDRMVPLRLELTRKLLARHGLWHVTPA